MAGEAARLGAGTSNEMAKRRNDGAVMACQRNMSMASASKPQCNISNGVAK